MIGMAAPDSGVQVLAHRGDGAIDAVAIDVEVGDEAQRDRGRWRARRATSGAPSGRRRGRSSGRRRRCSICGASTVRPGHVDQAVGEPCRERVVVGEALDVVVERVQRRRGDARRPGACRRRASCASGARRAMNSREPTSAEPTGAPRPFEKQTETLSNGAAMSRAVARGSPPSATAALKSRAPSRCVARPRLLRERATPRRGRRSAAPCRRSCSRGRAAGSSRSASRRA